MANPSNQHREWENQWREAFDGAEAPPAPHVWKNIESELVIRETGKYRRGFLLYRAIAAALLLLIAGLSWYIVTQQKSERDSLSDADAQPDRSEQVEPEATQPHRPSDNSGQPVTEVPTDEPAFPKSADGRQENLSAQSAADASGEKAPLAARPPKKTGALSNPPSLASRDMLSSPSGKQFPKSASEASSRSHTSLIAPATFDTVALNQNSLLAEHRASEAKRTTGLPVATVASQRVAEPSVSLPASLVKPEKLYQVPQPLVARTKDKKASRSTFFAGLAVAPGYFDPQLQTSAVAPNDVFALAGPSGAPGQNDERNEFNLASVPSTSSGINDNPELSLTYGIDVGMKLSEHWVIESGIDYNRFSTNAETRWAVADVATGNRYPYLVANRYQLDQTAARPSPTMTTSINNAYEFISVPMQIGYQVAVSRLNFILSSGVAANFFLGNNISAPASPFADTRVSAGENSPFKALYYSGVLSGGVNYNILENYSFSLTPSYTFALTELTRQESALNSQPYSFGINVGFQYQF